MKLKLPCCENNQNSPNAHWECSYCECVFENADLRDVHHREIHPEQLAAKRKMKCCHSRKSKRQSFNQHQCRYCDCMFPNQAGCDSHMEWFHQCKCGVIMLTEDDQAQHKIMHKKEAQMEQVRAGLEEELERLQKQRQSQMDDDFVLVYVKANKLNQYRPQMDYAPDFSYIFANHRLETDELVRLVKKFKQEFLEFVKQNYRRFGYAEVIDLVDEKALSIEDVASILDARLNGIRTDDVVAFVSYLLDKEYKIKPKWVVNVIDNNELIRRIKQKHIFTFNEIYEARERGILFLFLNFPAFSTKEFRAQVHRHFPDPNFDEKSNSDSYSIITSI